MVSSIYKAKNEYINSCRK